MKSILLSALNDAFGVSKANLKTLLQAVEDDEGEDVADELEAQIVEREVTVMITNQTVKRFFLKGT